MPRVASPAPRQLPSSTATELRTVTLLPPANDRPPEARLLVVDDEPNIVELLSASLRFAGFEVVTATNGNEAVAAAVQHRPDLVLLDVMLPDVDGFVVLRRLRDAYRHVPVVFLTARDAGDDKVAGLTQGGDDYVTKPFSLEEVVARIRAVLRRAGHHTVEGLLTVGDIQLDDVSHEVRRDGRPIDLSPTEFNLLRYLMRNTGRVVSKTQILDVVWGYDFAGDPNIVETYVSYLRRKLDDGHESPIHTVRGVGYVLRAPRLEPRPGNPP
jgi:two-component system, OmpR family, response regulator